MPELRLLFGELRDEALQTRIGHQRHRFGDGAPAEFAHRLLGPCPALPFHLQREHVDKAIAALVEILKTNAAAYAGAASAGAMLSEIVPTPSIRPSTKSPGLTGPTPSGVPVKIRSPG